MILVIAIVLPILAGALLPLLKLRPDKVRFAYIGGITLLTSILAALGVLDGAKLPIELLRFSSQMSVSLRLDGVGRIFACILIFLWPLATLYALEYMRHEEKQDNFFSFFMMSYGVTLGIASSANLLTLYIFYEMMTLTTLPLVMHGGSAESIAAGLKYLYYSLGGAAFAFIGLVYLIHYSGTTVFVWGGLFTRVSPETAGQLRIGYLLCFLGFSVKAAIFPLHGWLPTASVAPTPVTALLHAVAVVKSGVFALIRVTWFSFGPFLLRGTYAQYIPLALVAFTIVYGCAMALKEQHLKRRLAYSTVSNLSYILFGALLLTPQGLAAGLQHMIFHAVMKITLFLCAGSYMVNAKAHYVQDLRGISRPMPLTGAVFVLGSLAMTGFPPLIGFISKWSLAQAALAEGGLLPTLGVIALLISAVLTGIYLLVPSFSLYAGKRPAAAAPACDGGWKMRTTLSVLSAALLVMSFYSAPLLDFILRAASGLV